MNKYPACFCSHFVGRGREVLSKELGAPDPFGLTPNEILDRVLCSIRSCGDTPPQREEFLECGLVVEIRRGDQWFLVQICRDREMIAVQEFRTTASSEARSILDAAM